MIKKGEDGLSVNCISPSREFVQVFASKQVQGNFFYNGIFKLSKFQLSFKRQRCHERDNPAQRIYMRHLSSRTMSDRKSIRLESQSPTGYSRIKISRLPTSLAQSCDILIQHH